MKRIYFFLLLSMMNLCDASSKKIQVRQTLSRSNKIPVKSIKMRPSLHPQKGPIGEGEPFKSNAYGQEDKKPIAQLWQLSGECPEGTVPIRRSQKARNFKRYAKKYKSFSQLDDRSTHEYAIASVLNNKYFGAKATINVWQPQVPNNNELSLAQIWVTAGANSGFNSIEAGYMVSPSLYGDNNTSLFTFWTRDGYQSTGCYNLFCLGFIQTNKTIALGATISPVSTYHGAQYDIILYIFKDPKQNVWWLQYGNDDVIGYWPASILTGLADSASGIQWGGEVVNTAEGGQHTKLKWAVAILHENRLEGQVTLGISSS